MRLVPVLLFLLSVLAVPACAGLGQSPLAPGDGGEVAPLDSRGSADAADSGQLAEQTGQDTGNDSGAPLPDVQPEACIPQCAGKECGPDGCGGTCGKCPAAAPQCEDGLCHIQCVPDCTDKECGDDGCGGSCGQCPTAAPFCKDSLCAVQCDADCNGKECGDDGCGFSCGLCEDNEVCLQSQCVCKPDCAGKECGDDGCAGSCGTCDNDKPFCVSGQCAGACEPDCTGKECGSDGCGGTCGKCPVAAPDCVDGQCACSPKCPPGVCGDDGCGGTCDTCACDEECMTGVCVKTGCGVQECGTDACGVECGKCPPGSTCTQGVCADSCELACKGKDCGPDGCGGTCGPCLAPNVCTEGGDCVPVCVPACAGKECGSDGCGGSCGLCTNQAKPFCTQNHCTAACDPACGIKACGPDSCGGSCGTCSAGVTCTLGGACGSTCSMCGFGQACYDLDFESGNMTQWSASGATVVASLGKTTPPSGGYMMELSTGWVFGAGASASFDNCLPKGSYVLFIRWKLFSEEFLEWCGSQFQDSLDLLLVQNGVGSIIRHVAIDDLCPPQQCPTCGKDYVSLDPSDIVLDQGEVWETGWKEDWLPIVLTGDPSKFTLTLALADAGDDLYDTVVLVDRIQLIPCDTVCEQFECGPNPCGGQSCGSCPAGKKCVDGQCCVASCTGKDCGPDGCGGTCGTCGTLSHCTGIGICECSWAACSDGCCAQGDVCSAATGKCCKQTCLKACGANGCGGLCPPLPGQTCCTKDADCDDGDDVCTKDLCVNNVCTYQPTGVPACCGSFTWERNFDDGTPQGFVIANSDGGFPGLGAGWSVSGKCGFLSPPNAMYFGITADGGFMPVCTYEWTLPFPLPVSNSGSITSADITLPAGSSYSLTFHVMADVSPGAQEDTLVLEAVKPVSVKTLWTKSNLPKVGPTWQSVTLPLPDLAGQTFQLRWTFDGTAGNPYSGKGILLDDIVISSLCGP